MDDQKQLEWNVWLSSVDIGREGELGLIQTMAVTEARLRAEYSQALHRGYPVMDTPYETLRGATRTDAMRGCNTPLLNVFLRRFCECKYSDLFIGAHTKQK